MIANQGTMRMTLEKLWQVWTEESSWKLAEAILEGRCWGCHVEEKLLGAFQGCDRPLWSEKVIAS
jgi:hypothetical protein